MGLCGNLQCAAWYLPAARARLISPVEADSSKPVRCPVSQVMQQPRVVGTFDFASMHIIMTVGCVSLGVSD